MEALVHSANVIYLVWQIAGEIDYQHTTMQRYPILLIID